MFKKTLSSLGLAALTAVFLTGASVTADAAVITINPGGSDTIFNNADVHIATNGTADLTGGDGTLVGGVNFTDTYFYTVDAGVPGPVKIVYDVFQQNGGNGVGIANLTFEWNNDGSTIVFTGGAGTALFPVTQVFSKLLNVGVNTFVVTGTVLAASGSYGASITAVPLPPAAVLFGTALFGIGALRRWKDKKGTAVTA